MSAVRTSDEQSRVLAKIDQAHGHVHRLADDGPLAHHILSQCVTGARVYACEHCLSVFSIEPDGETALWQVTFDEVEGSEED